MAFFRFNDGPIHPIVLAINKAIDNKDLTTLKKCLQKEPSLIDYSIECMNLGSNPPSKCKVSLLDFAAGLGSVEIVKYFLQEHKGFNKENALYFAAQNNNLHIVEVLLQQPVNPNKALSVACANGHLEAVKKLLKDNRVDPTTNTQEPIRMACANGHDDIVKILLRLDRVDPTANNYEALHRACEGKHFAIVRMLLEDDRVDIKTCREWADAKGDTEFFKTFFSVYRAFDQDKKETFLMGCKYGCSYEDMNRLLKPLLMDPKANNYAYLHTAYERGHFDTARSLLEDTRFDLKACCEWACEKGYDDFFTLVSRVSRYTRFGRFSYEHKNEALLIACKHGRSEAVKILLQDKDINPTVDNYAAPYTAFKGNNFEIVKLFLEHPKVDLEVCYKFMHARDTKDNDQFFKTLLSVSRLSIEDKQKIFYMACSENDAAAVKALLADKNIDPMADGAKAFWAAWWSVGSTEKTNDVMEALWGDPRIILTSPHIWFKACRDKGAVELVKILAPLVHDTDSGKHKTTGLYMACAEDCSDTVKVLLEDKEINLKAEKDYVLYLACIKRNESLVTLLLEKGADPAAENYRAFRAACGNGYYEIAEKLLLGKSVNLAANDYQLVRETIRGDLYNRSSFILIEGGSNILITSKFDGYNRENVWTFFLKILGDPRINHKTLFNVACREGEKGIVEALLDNLNQAGNPLVYPTEDNYEAFRTACIFSKQDVVNCFFKSKRIDSLDLFNVMCENGYDKLVKIFKNKFSFTINNLEIALSLACKNGHIGVVRELLENKEIDPMANQNEAIRNASQNGCFEIVELLLAHPKATAATMHVALCTACEKSQFKMVEKLWKSEKIDPTFDNNLLIRKASEGGFKEIVRELLNNRYVDPAANRNEAILLACQNGHVGIAEMLLANPHVDPTDQDNLCLYYACKNGQVEIVRLLLKDRSLFSPSDKDKRGVKNTLSNISKILLGKYRVEPSACENRALRVACKKGYHEIVEILLQDVRTNPAIKGDKALLNACQNNYPKVVKLLLNNRKIDPIAKKHAAIRKAYEKGHFGIIEIFLNSGCISNPGFENNWLLCTACEKGHLKAVNILLKNPALDTTINQRDAFCKAYEGKHTTIIETLLKDGRFDPRFNTNWFIQDASANGKLNVVKILLLDGRADPTDSNHDALRRAYEGDHIEVVEELLKDKRVNPAFDSNWLICEASKKGNIVLVKKLLQDPRVNPTDKHNALWQAYVNDRTEIFNLLLEEPRANLAFQNNWLICEASKKDNFELVKRLLKDPNVKPTDDPYNALKIAYEKNHTKVFNLLLEDPRANLTFDLNWLLCEACKKGEIDLVTRLLKNPLVEREGYMSQALRNAYNGGHFSIVKILLKDKNSSYLKSYYELACENNYIKLVQMLLEEPNFDPAYNNNEPIRTACEKGHIDIVKELLQQDRVDPTANHNEAVRMASRNGHLEVVEELLKNDDVDPTHNDNEAISETCKNNHDKIVSRLLLERRIDPHANNGQIITLACNASASKETAHTVLRSIGLHFSILSKQQKENIIKKLSLEKLKLDNITILLPVADKEGQISYITNIQQLKENWFKFDLAYLLELYTAIQKPFVNCLLDERCSNHYGKLALQIEDKLSKALENLFDAVKKDQKENAVIAYEKVLDCTDKIRSVAPKFSQHWLCSLGNGYLTACTEEDGVLKTFEDTAIEIFKLVWDRTLLHIPRLEATQKRICESEGIEKHDKVQLEKELNTAELLQSALDEELRNMEVAAMGIISAIQQKMKIPSTFKEEILTEKLPTVDLAETEEFLDKVIEQFDDFSNIDQLNPIVLSCLESILKPFFYNYLKTTSADRKGESKLEELKITELLKAYREHLPPLKDLPPLEEEVLVPSEILQLGQPTQNFTPYYNAAANQASPGNSVPIPKSQPDLRKMS